jgi:hypothetical protein
MALYALQMPLGLILGALLLRHLQAKEESGGAPSYPDA